MKRMIFLLIILPFLFFSCEKERINEDYGYEGFVCDVTIKVYNSDSEIYELYKNGQVVVVLDKCDTSEADPDCSGNYMTIRFVNSCSIKCLNKDCSSWKLTSGLCEELHSLDIRSTISGTVVIHDVWNVNLINNTTIGTIYESYTLKIEDGKFVEVE